MSKQAPYCFGLCFSKMDCKECDFRVDCKKKLYSDIPTNKNKEER